MTRSKIGPLALEAPLGGRGSQVFRAVHMQQKVQLAVRIFSVPMGMTPEAKKDFAEQMEGLKQLRHRNIVRCYGGGFDQRDAYLVYELVDGESLGTLLERRQRLAWEDVLQYGLQICDALQMAHEAKWIHGRIRPDKLIVSRDGSLIKLSDFRKDAAANNMVSGPRSAAELVYMAPECIEGDISKAGDLYSVGVVLYRMLTGHLPFSATKVEQLRHAIQAEPPAAVASLVFDCPVFLSAIIEKLLEKNPGDRQYSAAATALALREAEKRASQGLSVAQHAISGFSPLQVKSADRAEAEKLLGTKPKRERVRRESGQSFFESVWFMGLGLILILGGIVYFLLPLNEQQLRQRAEKQLAREDSYYREDARDRYLLPLIERFPESENADWAREQIELIEMEIAERQMERRLRLGRVPDNDVERLYLEANRYERFGDRVTALEKYTAIVQLMKDREGEDRSFVNLARRQMRSIQDKPPSVEELQQFLASKLEEAKKLEEAADIIGATRICENILSLYNGNQEMKKIVGDAQHLLQSLKSK